MNGQAEKYLTFALPMIRQVLANEAAAMDKILYFAIYRAAMQMNVTADKTTIYRHLVYMAARHEEHVPDLLIAEINEFFEREAADLIDDTGEIDPDEIIGFADTCDEYDRVKEWYCVYIAQEVCGVTLGSVPHAICEGRRWYQQYSTGQVPVSISTHSFFSWRNTMRTEYDRVRFAYYVAIRSLCGNGVAVTTSTAIRWRMVGARNADELKDILKDKKIKSIWEKYTTKRKYHEIMNDLISAKLINEMPYNRRTCVTASVMNEAAFVEAIAAKVRTMYAARKNAEASQSRNRLQTMLKTALNKN